MIDWLIDLYSIHELWIDIRDDVLIEHNYLHSNRHAVTGLNIASPFFKKKFWVKLDN